MSLEDSESQLELFDLANQPQARLRRESLGRFIVHLRYDQAILLSIGCLLAFTVVFAGGVERGKLLVRSEKLTLARQLAKPEAATPASAAEAKAETKAAEITEAKPAKASSGETATPQKVKPRTRIAQAPAKGKSRYAIQLATYSRPQLAKSELSRLQAKGVSAFLIIREGRTIVYAGPFPSNGDAGDILGSLKNQYQDCFIKSL